MKKSTKNRKQLIIFIVVCVAVVLLAVAIMLPLIQWVSQPSTQKEIQDWVASLGWVGILVMLLIQMLQVIVAIIPGEPFELMAGVLYGGLGGLIICALGCFFATLIVYWISKRLGRPVVRKLFGKKNFDQFSFLEDPKKQQTTVFLLFLIPGIPKDLLTYISGLGPMPALGFAILATFARIPAIAASTYIGGDIMKGNWVAVVVLFVVVGILGLLGIHYKDRVVAYVQHRKKEEH